MKELSKECIEAIDHLAFLEWHSVHRQGELGFKDGAKIVLTNPSILSAANLVSMDEMFEFAEWVYVDCVYDFDYQKKLWYGANSRLTTSELFTLYKQQP